MQDALINQTTRDANDRVDRTNIRGARAGLLKLIVWFGAVLLTGAFAHAQSVGAPGSASIEFQESLSEVSAYSRERDRRMAGERQESFRMRVAIPDAVGEDVADVFAANRDTGQKKKNKTTAPPPSDTTPSALSSIFLLAAWFLLVVLLSIRKFAPKLLNKLNDKLRAKFSKLAPAPRGPEGVVERHRMEEEGVTAFFTAFQAGPSAGLRKTALVPRSVESGSPSEAGQSRIPTEQVRAVKEFQAVAVKLLITQRSLLQEINRASDELSRQKMLVALRWEMHALKGEAGLPQLLPVWQVASALEGLLKQLTDKPSNLTPSTLRTVAGGVVLLDDLCREGLIPSLLASRPIKLLVVDNNSISRNAISRALERAFNPPDFAEDMETALTLTLAQAYDVIFLDAQLSGADGFEFCSRIHKTLPNRTVSVVFVADQSDFDLHAESTFIGGVDLIGKPFLTFEITLKALTLALRGRLPSSAQAVGANDNADSSNESVPTLANSGREDVEEADPPEPLTDSAHVSLTPAEVPLSNPTYRTFPDEPMPDALSTACLTRAAAHLGPVRDLFQAVFQTVDEDARQGILAEAYLRIHSFTPKADFGNSHPALQMSAALEGLLRKLLENPQNSTPSTLITVAAGLDLLVDLCVSGLESDLVSNSPIRILVVDDDPVARRAVTYALQMAFEKPQSAESGEEALALAAGKTFDLILMDVQMPGMDGFTACAKLHETDLNRTTPVVFITGQCDFNERSQMSLSGGSDFVSKPFLKSEITVKALTFALRDRLAKAEVVMT